MPKIIPMLENAQVTKIGGLKEVAENAGKKFSELPQIVHDPKFTLEHTPDWIGRDLVKPLRLNDECTVFPEVAKK